MWSISSDGVSRRSCQSDCQSTQRFPTRRSPSDGIHTLLELAQRNQANQTDQTGRTFKVAARVRIPLGVHTNRLVGSGLRRSGAGDATFFATRIAIQHRLLELPLRCSIETLGLVWRRPMVTGPGVISVCLSG